MIENLPNEEWKDIEWYEGLYQVSNLGRVKSLHYNHTNQERILKFGKNTNGYLNVSLCKEGKKKWLLVHRLVAFHFLPNPNNYQDVNHKDENKTNNCVNNLEWCSREYNCNYGTRNERVGETNTNGKCSKQVIQYDLEGNEINRFPSTIEIERLFGFSCSSISKCCNGKLKTAYGYTWRYA